MKRTIVLLTALFVAITACFAFTGVSKGDDIPIPLESLEFEEDLYHNLGLGGNLNGWYIPDTFAAGSNTMAASNMIYCISH